MPLYFQLLLVCVEEMRFSLKAVSECHGNHILPVKSGLSMRNLRHLKMPPKTTPNRPERVGFHRKVEMASR